MKCMHIMEKISPQAPKRCSRFLHLCSFLKEISCETAMGAKGLPGDIYRKLTKSLQRNHLIPGKDWEFLQKASRSGKGLLKNCNEMQRQNTQKVGGKRDKQHEHESTVLAGINPRWRKK